jgi:hypothetical protein
MSNKCKTCGQDLILEDLSVSIRGMYDMQLFVKFTGSTIDEIIDTWKEHISGPTPAIVGGKKVDDLGSAALCPITVMAIDRDTGKKIEIRRVGKMVMDSTPKYEEDLKEWRKAAYADPDISLILADAHRSS